MILPLSYNSSPRLNEFSVKRSEEFKGSDGGMPIQITYALNTSDPSEEKTCEVNLKLNIGGDAAPLNMSIEIVATFRVNGKPTKDELNYAAATLAGPVLFTSVHDHVAEITRKMNYPPLLLPFPDFTATLPNKKKGKKSK